MSSTDADLQFGMDVVYDILTGDLTEDEGRLLCYFRKCPFTSLDAAAEELLVSRWRVQGLMRTLAKKGRLHWHGPLETDAIWCEVT